MLKRDVPYVICSVIISLCPSLILIFNDFQDSRDLTMMICFQNLSNVFVMAEERITKSKLPSRFSKTVTFSKSLDTKSYTNKKLLTITNLVYNIKVWKV